MTETELHKGRVYVWRKGDPKHESKLRVTQITRRLVRAVSLTGSAYRPSMKGERFWNPKCVFLDECSPEGE
jgi:hypothetical protein